MLDFKNPITIMTLITAGDELSISVEVSPHIEECYHHTLVSDEDGGIPMAQGIAIA